jgi:hypothetical protein
MVLSGMQGLGLMLTGIIAGAGLLVLSLGWLSTQTHDDLGDDGEGTGCAILGGMLLTGAGYLAVRVLMAG